MKTHRFAYMTEPAREHDLRPHELRDGDAYATLLPALIKLGYEAGPLFVNHPLSSDPPGTSLPDTSLEDMRALSADDLLVITSRPPLNERGVRGGPRQVKVSHPSYNQFEQRILFPVLRRHLAYCARNQIVLTAERAERLNPGYGNRQDLDFYLKPNERKHRYEASYSVTSGAGRYEPFDDNRTTAAYLIHTPPLHMPDGAKTARVLAAFGVSGTIGLVFAHHLCAQKLPPFVGLLEDILRKPGFAMMEITVTKDVPRFYMTLDFSDTWEYKLITRKNGAPKESA